MADIESLELQITGDASKAKAGLDALIGTLDTLKNKVKGGAGLTSVANQVRKMADAAGKMNGSEGAKLESLAKGLQALSGLGNLKLSSSIANQISALGTAVKNLDGADFSKVKDLAIGLAPLETLGKSNLGSVLNQIKKLPDVMAELNKVDMGAFATKIKELTASLKPLADEMQKVANGFSAFPAKIQQLLKSGSKISSSNVSTEKSFANLAAKVTATIYTFKKVASAVASWINESNEYTENMNLFTVAMGEYTESAMRYANNVSDIMGIDTSDWIRNQGVFMTLATGFGVATDRAATMSQQLTQLGYDISSFYNTSVEDAMQRLQSGISGELEPLRRLGYDLSQARLEAIALSLGIDKSVSSMTQAEKAELRYYAIMTQVTAAQGDMARTLDAPANQLRIFKAQLNQAARALGNIFIPMLNAVLPYAIAAVKVIRLLANAIANLVGFTLPEVDYSNVTSGVDGASDKLEEATESATKFKKTLLGIDELNVLSDNSSNGSEEDTSGGGFGFELPTYDFVGDATNSKINAIVEQMKEWLGITEDINSWSELMDTRFGTILETVGMIGAAFTTWKLAKGFTSAISIVKDILSNRVRSLTIGVTLAITGFTQSFDGVGDAIENGLDGFNFGEILIGSLMGAGGAALLGSTLATWIDTAFAGSAIDLAITQAGINLGVGTAGAAGAAILGSFAGVILGIPAMFVGIYDAIKNGIDWLSGILIPVGATAAGAGIGAIVGMLGGPIGAGIGALIGLVVGLVTDGIILLVENWESVSAWFCDTFASVGEFLCDVWGVISLAASYCWSAIVDLFTPAFEWFSALFGSIWQTVSDVFYNIGVIAAGCWEIIKTAMSPICDWIYTNMIHPVANFFVGLWDGFVDGAAAAWEGIVWVFSEVGAFFSDTFEAAWNGIVDIFSVAGEIFTDIKDGIVSAFKVIVNGLITGLNKVVSIPFNGINKTLMWLKNIEILELKPFANLKEISVPQIPLLADGGVVSTGQMFIAREAGPEMVGSIGNRTAVANNDQIVESVSQGVYRAVVQAMSQSSGNQVVEAKVNDKVLFEVVVNRNRQETMRTGYSPLLGGV